MSRDFFANFIKQETVDRVTKAIKKWEEEELSEENIEKFVFEDLNKQKKAIIEAQMGICRKWGRAELVNTGPVSQAVKRAIDDAATKWVNDNIDRYKVRITKRIEECIERLVQERTTYVANRTIEAAINTEVGKVTSIVVEKILDDINNVDLING